MQKYLSRLGLVGLIAAFRRLSGTPRFFRLLFFRVLIALPPLRTSTLTYIHKMKTKRQNGGRERGRGGGRGGGGGTVNDARLNEGKTHLRRRYQLSSLR